MRLKSIGFRDAVAWLDEQDGLDTSSGSDSVDDIVPRTKLVPALHIEPDADSLRGCDFFRVGVDFV